MSGTPGLPHATGVFETLVVVDEMPDGAALNAELLAAIERRRAESEGVRVSNIGGWQSDTGMLHWGGEPALRLVQRMLEAAERFTVDVAATGAPRHEWRAEMWANVSPPSASNQVHTHPGAFWSAVYYVDDGYGGSEDPKIGGELVLIDPRMPMIMMTMPTLRFRPPGRPADEPQLKLRPKTGRIVLFPSWLSHGVLPYAGTAQRVSIAVNLRPVPINA